MRISKVKVGSDAPFEQGIVVSLHEIDYDDWNGAT